MAGAGLEERNGDGEVAEKDSKESLPSGMDTPMAGMSIDSGAYNNDSAYETKPKVKDYHLPESSDPDEIRAQFEFYVSDANLPTDQFLLNQTGGPENRPVPIKTICSFSRMQHFKPYTAVVDAIRGSKFLELVENGKSGEEMFKRKTPLDSKYTTDAEVNKPMRETDSEKSSLYIKGFPLKEDMQIPIEQFFQPYGSKVVRLRKGSDKQKSFKGSVFVEFDSPELADTFYNLTPTPSYTNGPNNLELKVMRKREYMDWKNSEIKKGNIVPKDTTDASYGGRGNRGRGEGGRGRGRGGGGRGRGGRGDGRGRGRGGSRGGYHNRDDDRTQRDWRDSRGKRDNDGQGSRRRSDSVDSMGRSLGKQSAKDNEPTPLSIVPGEATARAATNKDTNTTTGSKRTRDDHDDGNEAGQKKAKDGKDAEAGASA